MTATETVERVGVREFAYMTWAEQAERDTKTAISSIEHQLRIKLKIKAGEYEINPNYFGEMVQPYLRVAAIVDEDIVFCLQRDSRALAVVNWSCQEKRCQKIARTPVSDYITLGRALAIGEAQQASTPKCEQHS